MNDNRPEDRADTANNPILRRILIAAGIVLVALALTAVAVYAVAFLILAPMMQ
jgi:hypothetical protein